MRITRDFLMKVTQDEISRRADKDRGLIAIYLCGSMLEEEHLLGGTGDIDLVFIHADVVQSEREIVRLTDDVHLDIAHHLHKDYRRPRQLRMHPWWGPTLNGCTVMYDPRHFMDFTQASVRGQFALPDRVVERSRKWIEMGRKIWLDYSMNNPDPGPAEVKNYLSAVACAANAIATLTGPPLTERRFLLRFPERAQAVDRPGLYAGLLGLIGVPNLGAGFMCDWMPFWLAALEAIPLETVPARLHPDRRQYYHKAFEALLSTERPETALWPMLRTWTLAVNALLNNVIAQDAWWQAFGQLGLLGAGFQERLEALDAYLDLVDEIVETWSQKRHIWAG